MRESDIRPADLLAEYLRLSAEDATRFFPDPTALVERPCPGCGSTTPTTGNFQKNGFSVGRCINCQTLYVLAAPTSDALDAFYRQSPSQNYWNTVFFPAVAEARRTLIFRPRAERLKQIATEHGVAMRRVIDVGAGLGVFLEEARAIGLGHDHWAVEPSEKAAMALRAKNIQTVEGFACDAATSPLARTADLVVSFEVIEHLINPSQFFAELARLARPGGLVVVSGLCGTGFDIMTLGEHAKAVAPPHHLSFLSRAGAETAIQRAGLELVSFLTPGQLDVDIVRNVIADNSSVVSDPFLRHLLSGPPTLTAAFQTFLTDQGLSSHMWLVAKASDQP